MSLAQALAYFLREALVSLARSWKASTIAILAIAMSLFVGGFFFLITENLSRLANEWSDQLRVVVYLEDQATSESIAELVELLEEPSFVRSVERVSSEQATKRFRDSFPSLADVVDELEETPFPASLEAALVPGTRAPTMDPWLTQLGRHPAVALVDDDRDWLDRLSSLVGLARAAGLAVGAGLLLASAFTIASVIKLTAYLYVEEIAVLRLVGATEFFIRGPFYVEGLLQGLAGGLLALGGLALTTRSLVASAGESVYVAILLERFLAWHSILALVTLGGLAGLFGAVFSLRRESLSTPSTD